MVIVDTCGWIEWLVDGALAEDFRPWLADTERLLVPTSIQFELYKWVKRERDEAVALEAVAWTEQAMVIPLDSNIALLAADAALQYRLSFADAIIYASARRHQAELVTADDHFEGLDGVTFFDKRKSPNK